MIKTLLLQCILIVSLLWVSSGIAATKKVKDPFVRPSNYSSAVKKDTKKDAQTSGINLKISMVVSSGKDSFFISDKKTYKVGSIIGGNQVVSIEGKGVLLSNGIREFYVPMLPAMKGGSYIRESS